MALKTPLFPSNTSKSEWIVCLIELIGIIGCMALASLLLANLIDKHLFPNKFEYEDECMSTKSTQNKKPIVSPWCLLLLRHRLPLNDTLKRNGQPRKRHTLPIFDFLHMKLNEAPDYVVPKVFGQRVRLRNLNVAPSWSNKRQSHPVFETPGTQAQPFPHFNEFTQTLAPDTMDKAVIEHAKIFNHSPNIQVQNARSMLVTTTPHSNSFNDQQNMQISAPIETTTPMLIQTTLLTTRQPELMQIPATLSPPTIPEISSTESIVASKINIQSQNIEPSVPLNEVPNAQLNEVSTHPPIIENVQPGSVVSPNHETSTQNTETTSLTSSDLYRRFKWTH